MLTKEDMITAGGISKLFGVPVSTALLKRLGFEPLGKVLPMTIWRRSDLPAMGYRLAAHIAHVATECAGC